MDAFSGMQVGIDIVDVGRFERRLAEWPQLSDRLFSREELDYCRAGARPLEHLAVRFAAKEAVFKALGSGWPALSWLEVEVVTENRRPSIKLHGKAAETAGGRRALVSLTHDANVALAQVLLLGSGPQGSATD